MLTIIGQTDSDSSPFVLATEQDLTHDPAQALIDAQELIFMGGRVWQAGEISLDKNGA